MKNYLILLVLFLSTISGFSQEKIDYLKETPEGFEQRMDWFTDAKYGMFVHFGLYSQLGGAYKGESLPGYAEWIQASADIAAQEYAMLAATFNPEHFDAGFIAKTAKDAGMKYIVITSKHHEGFCLWDSEYTNFDVASTPFAGRDILAELSAACKKHGLKFCTYYSLIDWHHPSQERNIDVDGSRAKWSDVRMKTGRKAEYVTYMKNQIRELIEKYDSEMIWFDGDWVYWWDMASGEDLYQFIRELKPEIIINNRVAKRKIFKKDFGTPEQEHPESTLKHYWEACYTMNGSWGYKSSDHDWKTPEDVYNKLNDINNKGGNFLLNIGPDGNGDVPKESVDILLEVGKMLRKKGNIFLAPGTGQLQKQKIKILYGGIAHESNTFIPYMTKKGDFNLTRDIEEKETTRKLNNYYTGKNVEFVFTLLARTGPHGVVTKEAYESFRDEILEGARSAGKLDGIMLQMHGALHVEGYEDAQLDFIKSLRAIVGNDVIISGSFDLHGNMSKEFVSGLNILTAYRTAPHVDAGETIERAVDLLFKAIQKKQHPVIAHINIPVLIPGEKGITAVEPLKSLYEYLPEISKKEGLLDASIFVGMPWTDVYRAGMSVQVVAEDKKYLAQAQKEAQYLAEQIWAKREGLKFDVPTDNIDGAIRTARSAPESTVFITDSGDNTTAGAAGDGTLVMAKLMELGVTDAVLAGIVDPQAVAECEKVGVGGIIDMEIGGKLDTVFSKPLHIKGTVIKISEDGLALDTERKPAVVDVNGILLVLLNQRRSFIAPEDFMEVDIDPLKHKIVIVKLGYLYPGLRDIAPRTIMALTPGFANQTIKDLHYKSVRRPIYPLDPEMLWNVEFIY